MKNVYNTVGGQRSKRGIAGLVLAVLLLAAMATPVNAESARDRNRRGNERQARYHADQRRRAGEEWRNHERQSRRYWSRPYYYQEPRAVYAPPVIYAPPFRYAPQPEYVSPSIQFIIPLRIH